MRTLLYAYLFLVWFLHIRRLPKTGSRSLLATIARASAWRSDLPATGCT